MELILASASPRRAELLSRAGLRFEVEPAEVDERELPGESPTAFVQRVALLKASTVAGRHRSATVLAADTAVVVGGEVFGKPRNEADATRMLQALSARRHEVLTGVVLMTGDRVASRVETTAVWFSPLTPHDIAEYVASGEPLDKAGAYAIQGLASRYIPRIEGSYTNVVGLPVTTVLEMLRAIRGLAGRRQT
jgi:septum formation protein